MNKSAFRCMEIMLDAGKAVLDAQGYSRLTPPRNHGGGHILRTILVDQNLAQVSELPLVERHGLSQSIVQTSSYLAKVSPSGSYVTLLFSIRRSISCSTS